MLGNILILAFVLFSAFRVIYFEAVFQKFNFFTIVFVCFTLASLSFFGYSLYKYKGDLRLVFKNISLLFWMNVTTAIAWICYFFALRYLEPSLVNTIWAGIAPLILSVLSLKYSLFDSKPISSLERLFHIGIFSSLLNLEWAILTNRTGVGGVEMNDHILGLIATVVSSISYFIVKTDECDRYRCGSHRWCPIYHDRCCCRHLSNVYRF